MSTPPSNLPRVSNVACLQSLAARAAARSQQWEGIEQQAQKITTPESSPKPVEDTSLAKPTIRKRVRFDLDSLPVQRDRPRPSWPPPPSMLHHQGQCALAGVNPPPWTYVPMGLKPPSEPPRQPRGAYAPPGTFPPLVPPPPSIGPRPHCTHRRVEMDFSSSCSLCGDVPQGGFVYACRQDEDDENSINTRKSRYAYKDIRNPDEELTSICVSPSIVKSAADGFYTSEELSLVVAQRLNVIEACEKAEENERLNYGRPVRSPSSLNLHSSYDIPSQSSESETVEHQEGSAVADPSTTAGEDDDDHRYRSGSLLNKGKTPVGSSGGERSPPASDFNQLHPGEWYVPTTAQPTQQWPTRTQPHIPPCDFRACGDCGGQMKDRAYSSIDAVAKDDFHPSGHRETSRRELPRSPAMMRSGFHSPASVALRSADETGAVSTAEESHTSSVGSSLYSFESDEVEDECSNTAGSSEGTRFSRTEGSYAKSAVWVRSASLIELKPIRSRPRLNTESSPALHSKYRDDATSEAAQEHTERTSPVDLPEMDSLPPRTPLTPKGSNAPQPPMPPMPPYDSEEDVIWNRAKPIAHKSYYDNGTYFHGTYHRPFKLSDIPRRAATFMGIRSPISPRAMLGRATNTRKVTDPKDLPNGTILHSDSGPPQSTPAHSGGCPSDPSKSARATGRQAGAVTPESFITRTESALAMKKQIARKRSMNSIASSLKRMVSGSGKSKGFEVVRRSSEQTPGDAAPPEDHDDEHPEKPKADGSRS